MKRVFLFLLLLPFFVAHGQAKKKQTKQNQLSVGLNFSPDYDYRTLKNTDGSSSADMVMKTRNGRETGKFGYTTGVNICMNFTKLIGFEAGVQYSNKGYRTKNYDLYFIPPDPALPVKAKFIYNYHYVDIPLKVNFTVGKGKVQFISGAGLSLNIFIKERETSVVEYSNGKTDRKTESTTFDYNKIDISPMISLGIGYKINGKIYLKAEPVFRYGVLKIIDAPATAYLWNAGLNIGFYYGLK